MTQMNNLKCIMPRKEARPLRLNIYSYIYITFYKRQNKGDETTGQWFLRRH